MTLIEEMEIYAQEHDVPIMQKEGIDFMCSFLREHNPVSYTHLRKHRARYRTRDLS